MGMSSPEWSRYMHERIGLPESPEEINEEVVRRMLARYRESLPLIDGAVDAVRRLAGAFTLGVASSSNRPLIEVVLERAGIAELFAAVVSSEEVARGKPAPDVYLEAARRLEVEPGRCAADRGLLERDPRGARGRDARGRRAERALPARRRRARARRRGRRLAGRADPRAHPEVGDELHSRARCGCARDRARSRHAPPFSRAASALLRHRDPGRRHRRPRPGRARSQRRAWAREAAGPRPRPDPGHRAVVAARAARAGDGDRARRRARDPADRPRRSPALRRPVRARLAGRPPAAARVAAGTRGAARPHGDEPLHGEGRGHGVRDRRRARCVGVRRDRAQPARDDRGGGAPRRERGAGADRAGAARRDRAQRLGDRRPGRRGRTRSSTPSPSRRVRRCARSRRPGETHCAS